MLHARDADGNTALHVAAIGGHLEICRLLVRAGACAKMKNRDFQTPVDLARANAKTLRGNSIAVRHFLSADKPCLRNAEHGMQSRRTARCRERVYRDGESVLLSHEIRQGRMSIQYLRST